MPTKLAELVGCQVTAGRNSPPEQRVILWMWIESERDSGQYGSRESTLVPGSSAHPDAARSIRSDYVDHAHSKVRAGGSVATVQPNVRSGITRRSSVPNVSGHGQVFRAQTSAPQLKRGEGR